MATNDKDFPCDFCKRDEGLVLSLSRYNVISSDDKQYNKSGLYDSIKLNDSTNEYYDLKKEYLSEKFGSYNKKQWDKATWNVVEQWRKQKNEKASQESKNKKKIEIDNRWNEILAEDSQASRVLFEEINKNEFNYINDISGETILKAQLKSDYTEEQLIKYLLNPEDIHILELERIVVEASKIGFYYEELKNLYEIETPKNFAYDLRLLRKGYVYVFSEHLGSFGLEKYEVNEKGFLKKVPLKSENKIATAKKEPCSKVEHQLRALTITIKKPKEAQDIWIKYSEVEWTKAIEKKVFDQQFRKDNMIVLNVPSILKQSDDSDLDSDIEEQKHVTSPDKFFEMISTEFKDVIVNEKRNAGNVSSIETEGEYITIGDKVDRDKFDLLSEEEINEILAKNNDIDTFLDVIKVHANVILTDAVGLLMDIGGKMAHEKSKLIDTNVTNSELTNEEKTLITYNSLNEMLRLAVFDQTLEEADSDNTGSGFFSSIFQNKKKNLEELNTEEIEKLAKEVSKREIYASYDMWGAIDYKKYFSAKETLKLKEQNVNQTIEELGEWYISLLSNDFILKSLNSNYDEQDIINNVEFTTNTLNIVRNSMLAKCVIEYYKEKLQSKVDDNNIILKAFSMNNKKMMDLVQNQLDLRGLVWGDVLTKTKAFFDEVTKTGKVNGVPLIDAAKGSLDELLSASSPAIIAAQAPKMDSLSVNNGGNVPKNLSPALMIVGGYTNNPSIAIDIKFGSQKDFYKKIAAAMVRAVQNVAPDQIVDKRRLEKEIRKIKFYEQLSLKGTVEFKALFPKYAITRIGGQIDFERLVAASFYKNKTGFVPLFPNDTTFTPIITDTPTAEPRVNANLDIAEMSEKLGSKTAVSVGTLNGLFQILNFQAVLEAIQNKQLLGVEAFSRMSAAIYGVVTGIAEATIYTISCLVSKKHFFRRWEPILNKKVLPLVGKIAAVLGMITALFDIYNGIKIAINGDIVEGILLASSGGLILYSSFLFFFNATNPIGWVLLILGLSLGLAYNIVKKPELEKWLLKSFLGERIGVWIYSPYKTYEQQQKALYKMLNGGE